MFQIIAHSLRLATRTEPRTAPLPREADLPRLSAPVGWGSLRVDRPRRSPSSRAATLAPCTV